jgi:hypothetical protein
VPLKLPIQRNSKNLLSQTNEALNTNPNILDS